MGFRSREKIQKALCQAAESKQQIRTQYLTLLRIVGSSLFACIALRYAPACSSAAGDGPRAQFLGFC